MPPRVLVAGHVTLDRYDDAWLPGGSAWYAGRAWSALGAEVRVVTAAGPDFPAAALEGLAAIVVPSSSTTRFANVHRADGTRTQRAEGRATALSPASIPAGWDACDVLHLAPVLRELDLDAWTRAVRARLVGVGVQGWVRDLAPGGDVVQPPWQPDPALLRGRVHAACVGEDDLRGQPHLPSLLASSVPVIAFTHGERGCDVWSSAEHPAATGRSSSRAEHIGVYRTRAVDPVGAGDVFSAGFFFALARGDSPADAARLGAAAASVVVEGRAGETLSRVGEAFARSARVA